MPIYQDIKKGITDSMRSKDTERLSTLRSISAAFTNELVAKGRKPQEELSDEEALSVIRRLVKQRRDSIEQYKKGGREDLAQAEAAELVTLEEFMPPALTEDEIRLIAQNKKQELGVDDKSKMGILIGAVMKEAGGRADGTVVKKAVESLF